MLQLEKSWSLCALAQWICSSPLHGGAVPAGEVEKASPKRDLVSRAWRCLEACLVDEEVTLGSPGP